MFSHLKKYDVVLGSSSPRRKELLDTLGFSFRVVGGNTKEIIPKGMKTESVAEYLAGVKSDDLFPRLHENSLLITADTVVVLDSLILGKPADDFEAEEMLISLSGKIHQVITGVVLRSHERTIRFSDETVVKFLPVSQEEARWYISQNLVTDKAGAYGIQDWIGMTKVKSIAGSFYNVMGLPVHRIYEELMNW